MKKLEKLIILMALRIIFMALMFSCILAHFRGYADAATNMRFWGCALISFGLIRAFKLVQKDEENKNDKSN